MLFGLTNAPATFQAFIDKASGEFLYHICGLLGQHPDI